MPDRIQLQRTRGWRKPAGTVVVARPGRWGNPFPIPADADDVMAARAVVVERFRDVLLRGADSPHWATQLADRFAWMHQHLADLTGHDLACWCPLDGPCHADVLLEVADR